MDIRVKFLLIFSFSAVITSANAGFFGPSNFDECVIESMKGVTSDRAAAAIYRSCRAKFPVESPKDSEVPENVRSRLDGRAAMTNYGFFKGDIYNGNEEWSITQVTIALTPKTKDKSLEPLLRDKEYNIVVTIPPLTNSDFSVSVSGEGSSGFDWTIIKARGYKK